MNVKLALKQWSKQWVPTDDDRRQGRDRPEPWATAAWIHTLVLTREYPDYTATLTEGVVRFIGAEDYAVAHERVRRFVAAHPIETGAGE